MVTPEKTYDTASCAVTEILFLHIRYKWTRRSPYHPEEQQKILTGSSISWYRKTLHKRKVIPPDDWLFKVGDKVEILEGKDKGKQGDIIVVSWMHGCACSPVDHQHSKRFEATMRCLVALSDVAMFMRCVYFCCKLHQYCTGTKFLEKNVLLPIFLNVRNFFQWSTKVLISWCLCDFNQPWKPSLKVGEPKIRRKSSFYCIFAKKNF